MAQVIPINESLADDVRATTQAAFPSVDDDTFVAKVHTWWQEADAIQTENIEAEKKDHRFALGHQWEAKDEAAIKASGRVPLVINKTLPAIMVVSGHERGNRMRVRYLPVEQGDTDKAEVWTEVARVVQEQGELDFVKSEAFLDMLLGGRGFMEVRIDYTGNPQGEIVGQRVSSWELRIDPTSVRYDLGDARYLIRAKQVSYEELLVLWPEKSEDILGANLAAIDSKGGAVSQDRDIKYDYNTLIGTSYRKADNTWQLLEVWYWQVEKIGEFAAKNPQSGIWEPLKDRKSILALLAMTPELEWRREPKYERRYYQAFICGPLLLENNPSPYEWKGFPFVQTLGLKDEQTGRFLGMVYSMRHPQMEVNKRRTQVLHILNQAAKSGWYGARGTFLNRDTWEKDSSKAGALLEWDPNPALPDGGKPQQIMPQPLPSAFIELEKLAAIDLRDVSGVNIELMGLSQRDTPGIVTSQRQKQALTILQTYFDNLRRSTKLLGRILLSMMQQFYTDGRQFQITGKTGMDQRVALTQDYKVGRYDLVAEEAPYSPNQKMETAIKLSEIIKTALSAGIPVPPDVLDYMDLPVSLTNKWKEMLVQKQQQMAANPLANMKEFVDLDRLFPLLTPMEQAQLLEKLGIKPDMQGRMLKQAVELQPQGGMSPPGPPMPPQMGPPPGMMQ